MKLRTLEIKAFGRFRNFRLELPEGIVVLEGGNEAGKTTLLSFILLMFYGNAGAEKSSDLQKSLRKRYLPWECPEAMGGAIEMEFEGQLYRVEKQFRNSWLTDQVVIYNLQSGARLVPDRQQEVGDYFFHISADTFLKTMLLGEQDRLTNAGDTKELVYRLRSLALGGEEEWSASEVEERLQRWQYKLVSRRGDRGALMDARKEEAETREQLERVRAQGQEYTRLREQEEVWTDDLTEIRTPLAILFGVLSALLGIAGIALLFFLIPLGLCLLAVGASLVLLYRSVMRRQRLLQEQYYSRWQTDVARQQEYLDRQLKKNREEEQELLRTLERQAEARETREKDYEAVHLAVKALHEAEESLSKEYIPQLNRLTREYLSNLTRGKYTDLLVTPELSLFIREQETGAYREWKYLSRATVRQAYFALRLAVLDLLCEQGELLPVLLDDVFADYDAIRLEDAQDFLTAYAERRGIQVLFFTCHPHMFQTQRVHRIVIEC